MPAIQKQAPEGLRPYKFHGMDLAYRDGDREALADCPWCGKEGHFSVNVETGVWICRVCGEGTDKGGGNASVFLKLLWEQSDEATRDYSELQLDRGLLEPETLVHWQVCRSTLDGRWLVPGYNVDGSLTQLYSWRQTGDKYLLFPTPTLGHAIHGIRKDLYQVTYLCEGPWDAMALWEVLGKCKWDGDKLTQTANPNVSLRQSSCVLAVPGCNVFQTAWLPMFAGRKVILMYDSDHPGKHPATGKELPPAGYSAMRRVTRLLSETREPPEKIQYLNWGERGYDPSLKHGYDVRDWLSVGRDFPSRIARLQSLLEKVVDVPQEWLGTVAGRSSDRAVSRTDGLGSLECRSYKDVLLAWRKALRWRQEMEDVLSVMLAVALSTSQVGDQLFLQVIGDAGSGKTRFCDAMLVSERCFALEHLTGFHSGWKDESGEDYSLLSRINHKTLITPEGDVMMSSPHFIEIMSQQRRIFDGTSGATYKNRKEDLRYTGLRTPWIIAGTPSLMNTDQSRLGDRFLRVCINPPTDDEKREILRRVAFTAMRSVVQTSDGDASSHVDKNLALAYQLTGGYVDYLVVHAEILLSKLIVDEERVADYCSLLGEFTADLRARPDPDHKKEVSDHKEMPTRLTHQYVRLAYCLAVVLGKKEIDSEVLRVVRKVAVDTGRGRTLQMVHYLYDNIEGLDPRTLASYAVLPYEKVGTLLRFLRSIKVAEVYTPVDEKGTLLKPKWRLTVRMRELYQRVMEGIDA